MMGSQVMLSGSKQGPQLPGMENLGADAIMMGGIEEASDIPKGMQFIASSVPDDEFSFDVAASSEGTIFLEKFSYIYVLCLIVFLLYWLKALISPSL